MKQMESRIVYHMEKYVAFLFGEKNKKDPEQRMYNKLLQLEGEELEVWVNGKLKKYIIKCDNVKFVDRSMSFKNWYNYHINCESDEVMCIKEIYGNCSEEYLLMKQKLQNYQMNTLKYVRILTCELDFIINYIEMLIMSTNYDILKSFIIQQVDPVEIR